MISHIFFPFLHEYIGFLFMCCIRVYLCVLFLFFFTNVVISSKVTSERYSFDLEDIVIINQQPRTWWTINKTLLSYWHASRWHFGKKCINKENETSCHLQHSSAVVVFSLCIIFHVIIVHIGKYSFECNILSNIFFVQEKNHFNFSENFVINIAVITYSIDQTSCPIS